jgi:hypothetical protein
LFCIFNKGQVKYIHMNENTVHNIIIYIYIYMIDWDRHPVSNQRPILKLASIDVIISNHGPIKST